MRVLGLRETVAAVAALVSACTGSVSAPGSTSSAATAGAGGGVPAVCTPGATEACYEGPAGTEGIGACVGGTRECAADGSGFGSCNGQVMPKQESCATEIDDNCDGVPPVVCPGPLECGNVFGSPGTDEVYTLAVGDSGSVFIGGRLYEPVDFGGAPIAPPPGEPDGFVAAFAPTGEHVFSRAMGGSVNELPYLAAQSDGGLLLAVTYGETVDLGAGPLGSCGDENDFNVAVASLDSAGGVVWSRAFTSVADNNCMFGPKVSAVEARSDGAWIAGELWVMGDFGGGAVEPVGTYNGYIARLSVDGEFQSVEPLGGPDGSSIHGLASSPSGEAILSGDFAGALDAAGLTGGGALVMKLASDSSVDWAHAVPAGTHFWDVATDADGNVYGALMCWDDCEVEGTLLPGGFAIVALSPSGELRWTRWLGYGAGGYVDADLDGNVVAGGVLAGSVDWGGGTVGDDLTLLGYAVRFDSDGDYVGSKTWPDLRVEGVAFALDGDIVIAGSLDGTVDFGCGPLTSVGELDAFVAKVSIP